jgi:hypothetical protein
VTRDEVVAAEKLHRELSDLEKTHAVAERDTAPKLVFWDSGDETEHELDIDPLKALNIVGELIEKKQDELRKLGVEP